MSSELHKNTEYQILAYHMGWLDREEMLALEQLIESDAQLRARSEALANAVEPLSTWNTLPIAEQLEDQVLRHVEHRRAAGSGSWRAVGQVKLTPAADQRVPLLRWPFSIRDLVATAACIAIMLLVVVPSLSHASARVRRTVCLNRLQRIGVAQAGYTRTFNDWLPFAGSVPDATIAAFEEPPQNWLRERSAGVSRLRNSRHRFLLIKQGFFPDGEVFLCPADAGAVLMRFDDLDDLDDFPERSNCSYDSQILTRGARIGSADPRFVMYADSNPLFDSRVPEALATSGMNSQLHDRLGGQNVLRLDGAVRWASSPNAGVQNDNIWQIGQLRNYTGSELPQFSTDSFMIP